MAFMVSPGVEINEIDLTNVVPAVSTSIGAIAGSYAWGPVEEIVQVGSEDELVSRFFQPNDTTFKYFFPAAQFLQYSNDLRVVRTANDGQLNASQSSGELIKNESDFENKASFSTGNNYLAKYPGELGNALGVWVITSADAFTDPTFTATGYDTLFNDAPGTSAFAERKGVSDDELHIVVYDATGAISGTRGEVLETFEGLSQARGAKRLSGANNYYVDVLNNQSRYLWVGETDSQLPDSGKRVTDSTLQTDSDGPYYTTVTSPLSYSFTGGSDGTVADASIAEIQTAYDLFQDAETVDVNFIIGPQVADPDDEVIANYLISIANDRRDVIAVVSPSIERTVNNINAAEDVIDWADNITSSSYGVLDSGALYVFDKYNDVYRWVVASGSIAGLCAYTDNVSDPWFSPAGFNRGQLRNVVKLAFNPIQAERDSLYKARVNPIVSFPGQGIVLYGDKTAQAKASAFDRINVRRLFITLEKAISTAAKSLLFEINDEFTRAQFRNLVEPFLRDVQGRRGLTAFSVVCDETNNTPQVIDTNRFVADIFIQPARSINFITLNFVAVRTGVQFEEIAGEI